MDKIQKLTPEEFKEIASKTKFSQPTLSKDYYVTLVVYLLKNVNGIYFKGGTAIQKIILNHSRLSEDADYSVTEDLDKIKKEITEILQQSNIFNKITYDKDVDGFTRIVAHYKNFSDNQDTVFIDLNKRAKLSLTPETHKINQYYEPFIPAFAVPTVAIEEMIAEKMAATIGRNKPRDHFDLYQIIRSGRKINLELIKIKCEQSDDEYNITKMFHNAAKLKNRWDQDMIPLLAEEITFQEVMKTLSEHFKLRKEERNIAATSRKRLK